MKKKERIKWIDVLKMVGLMCIVLAHTTPPDWLFQLRNFDVILLIVVSMYLYFGRSHTDSYGKYLLKRLKRLLIPTYLFLIVLFLATFCVGQGFELKTIFSSFALHDGIGYVWIVRIYLLAAMITPVVEVVMGRIYTKKRKSGLWGEVIIGTIVMLSLMLLQELLCKIGVFNANVFAQDVIAYLLPLLAVALFTFSVSRHNDRRTLVFYILMWTLVFFACFMITANQNGGIMGTQVAKYPFRLYYLSYALAITSILFLVLKNKKITEFLASKYTMFVSSMSFWIYLWHIPIIMLLQSRFSTWHWILKFTVAVVGASLIVYVQLKIVTALERRYGKKEIFKILKG